MQALARERIQMYDRRVEEAVRSLIDRYPEAEVDESLWPAIKLAYIGLIPSAPRPSTTRSRVQCCTGATTTTSSFSGGPQ
jgi:isocitrate dehydrogenase kinase/phosphatase